MQLFQLILVSCVALVYCYPDGSPGCKQNVPSHGKHKAKSGKSPYTIVATAPKALPNGDKIVTVTITGGKGNDFKGFHVTARSPTSSATLGKFTAASNAKIVQCNAQSNAITHTDNNDKTSVSFTWTAPKKFKGKVEFRATVVKEFKEFYGNIRSSQVTIS